MPSIGNPTVATRQTVGSHVNPFVKANRDTGESILTEPASHHVEAGREFQSRHGQCPHSAPLPRAEHPQTFVDPTSLNDEDPLIVDDLGECVPVCTAELDVIEMYLDHILLELLDRNRPTPKADEG